MFFHEIRTVQQWGYSVHSYVLGIRKFGGYALSVTTSKITQTTELKVAMDEFISNTILVLLQKLTADELNELKNVFIESINQPIIKVKNQIMFDNNEIVSGKYQFDRKEKMIEHIRTITTDDLLNFYQEFFVDNYRKVIVTGYCKNGVEEVVNEQVNETSKLNNVLK